MRMQMSYGLFTLFLMLVSCTEKQVSVVPGEYIAESQMGAAILCIGSDGTYSQHVASFGDSGITLKGRWTVEYGYGDPRLWMTRFISFRPGSGFVDTGNGILLFGDSSFVDGVDVYLEYKRVHAKPCKVLD
jgi:hypothetical protein